MNKDDFHKLLNGDNDSVKAYLFQISPKRFRDGSKTDTGVLRYINENQDKKKYMQHTPDINDLATHCCMLFRMTKKHLGVQ